MILLTCEDDHGLGAAGRLTGCHGNQDCYHGNHEACLAECLEVPLQVFQPSCGVLEIHPHLQKRNITIQRGCINIF